MGAIVLGQSTELIFLIGVPAILLALIAILRFLPAGRMESVSLACLGVVLIGAVFGHSFFHVSAGPLPLTLDRGLLGLTMLWFVWRFLTGREHLAEWNSLDLAILVWLVVITASTLSHNFKIMDNMPLSRLLFFNWMPVALYLLIRHCQLELWQLRTMAAALVLFALYLAVTGIAESRGWTFAVFPGYIMNAPELEFLGRGRGPFLNPVSNGMHLILGFCCCLLFWPGLANHHRIWIIGIAALISLGVLSTLTRSIWLSLIVASGILVFLPAQPRIKGALLIAGTVVAFALFPIVSEKILSFKRDQNVSQADMEQSAQLRPLFALVAWNMFQDRPWQGVGFGQYAKTKYPYLQDPHAAQPLSLTRSFMQHNVVLAYVTETGLIGTAALLAWIGLFLTIAWRLWRDDRLPLLVRQMGLVGVALMICYLVNGMFHDVSIAPKLHLLMFFWMGLVNNLVSRSDAWAGVASSPESLRVPSAGLTSSLPSMPTRPAGT